MQATGAICLVLAMVAILAMLHLDPAAICRFFVYLAIIVVLLAAACLGINSLALLIDGDSTPPAVQQWQPSGRLERQEEEKKRAAAELEKRCKVVFGGMKKKEKEPVRSQGGFRQKMSAYELRAARREAETYERERAQHAAYERDLAERE
ncbi:hypothetical protein LTR36_006545 [Oleoguttula mirabilis]|uniref:Uncharacterized protein n=1 Tax=Oleoguttula mirabilis TaxID=1507867 RepID=A0AAV9JVF5_9PEZI|nr:hypothetical protein LTR36_006545 [Oleoguttula mirabilis]